MDILESKYSESCIYCILNYDNGKMYFGLTKNYKIRVRDHVNELKRNKHHNSYLQNVYNKMQKLIVFPVEKCNAFLLKEREMFWIKYHQSYIRTNGYNLTLGGEDLSHMTKEALIRKANSRRGKSGSLKGRAQSPEHIKARVAKTKGQKRNYTKEHLEAIKNTRHKAKGSRQKGKPVTITNLETNKVLYFNSKREVEDFFNIKRDSLIHKFYYGRPRQKLKKIIFNNYLIER